MTVIILRVIIYYLLIGMLFVLSIHRDIDDMIDMIKSFIIDEKDEEISKIPPKNLRRYVIIVFIILWPVFAYQISKRNKL